MNKKGFSLIELLIVISIVGVLAGIGAASYNDFNRRQIIRNSALGFKSNVKETINRALAGENTECSASSLSGYQITFTSTSYSIKAVCSNPSTTTIAKTTNLPSSVTFISGSPPLAGMFLKGMGLGVDNTYNICLSGYGLFYKMVVTTTGEVKDYDISPTCP